MRELAIIRALNTALAFVHDSLGEQPARVADEAETCPRCIGQSEGGEADLCPACLREIQLDAEVRGETQH